MNKLRSAMTDADTAADAIAAVEALERFFGDDGWRGMTVAPLGEGGPVVRAEDVLSHLHDHFTAELAKAQAKVRREAS